VPSSPKNRSAFENEETEPLPPELAAFAKDPNAAKRLLDDAAQRRPSKPLAPVQPMVPSGHGEIDDLPTKRLKRVLEINKAINTERDQQRLMAMIMDAAIELSSALRGFFVLWDRGKMQVVQARNIDRNTIASPEAAVSRRLIREAIERRETVVTARAATERDGYASATGLDLKSVMVSPLISNGQILGALYLDEPEKVGVFKAEDVRTLESFCDQAAIAVQNAKRVEEMETRMESQRLRLRRVEAEVRRRDKEEVASFGNLQTQSPKLKRVFDLLKRVAETSFPVIVQGESGTGKELLAKAIHYTSLRRDEPFVAMNCAAVPETLIDSELFGYNAGAFTGAVRSHKGLFEQAHGGSLFLDEIEEMSPAMQGKLLRVLQEGEIRRVGAKNTITVDVRVIAASNQDIQAMVESGEFRRDLYYRLNVIPVEIPPLRDRLEDLPQLVNTLLLRLAKAGGSTPTISLDTIETFSRYRWPGNVRELENELKRLGALGVTDITVDELSDHIRNPDAPTRGEVVLPTLNIKEIERLTIERALASVNNNKTHAAKLLGLSRRGLLKKLERYRANDEAAELENSE
jgi:transcriptional regulator with GAF, ATPase, and Fis domain